VTDDVESGISDHFAQQDSNFGRPDFNGGDYAIITHIRSNAYI
jgi:hypothetical protein